MQGSTVPSEARLAENKCMLVIAEIQESVLQLLPSLPLDYVVTRTAELGAGERGHVRPPAPLALPEVRTTK